MTNLWENGTGQSQYFNLLKLKPLNIYQNTISHLPKFPKYILYIYMYIYNQKQVDLKKADTLNFASWIDFPGNFPAGLKQESHRLIAWDDKIGQIQQKSGEYCEAILRKDT